MSYLTPTISHGKRVLPYVRGRRVHEGPLWDLVISARWRVGLETGRRATLTQPRHSCRGAHWWGADASTYSSIYRLLQMMGVQI